MQSCHQIYMWIESLNFYLDNSGVEHQMSRIRKLSYMFPFGIAIHRWVLAMVIECWTKKSKLEVVSFIRAFSERMKRKIVELNNSVSYIAIFLLELPHFAHDLLAVIFFGTLAVLHKLF